MQTDVNGDRHPCAYLSKSFSPAERNYEVYDWELLGIIRALRDWRHYVQGSPHETIVYSDHKNLTYFRNPQKLNRRQAGWSLELSEYNLKLIHLPGTRMIQSDTLSRHPDFYLDDDDNNTDITLLPDDLFVNLVDNNESPTLTRMIQLQLTPSNFCLMMGPLQPNLTYLTGRLITSMINLSFSIVTNVIFIKIFLSGSRL